MIRSLIWEATASDMVLTREQCQSRGLQLPNKQSQKQCPSHREYIVDLRMLRIPSIICYHPINYNNIDSSPNSKTASIRHFGFFIPFIFSKILLNLIISEAMLLFLQLTHQLLLTPANYGGKHLTD